MTRIITVRSLGTTRLPPTDNEFRHCPNFIRLSLLRITIRTHKRRCRKRFIDESMRRNKFVIDSHSFAHFVREEFGKKKNYPPFTLTAISTKRLTLILI